MSKVYAQPGSFVVAIPSYKRFDTLKAKSLATCARLGISNSKVYVFVANDEELKVYAPLRAQGYHVIKGVIGLMPQRGFMTRYFKEGQCILYMDDDIEDIQIMNPDRQSAKSFPPQKYVPWLTACFDVMKKTGTYLMGIYPVANAFFMSPTATMDLKFVVGCYYGVVNRHDSDLELTLSEKEDVNRTLLHYKKDGRILRVNYVVMKTKYYKEQGGMQAFQRDRKADALKSAHYLSKHFPDLCTLYEKKKSGYAEVRLKDKKLTTAQKKALSAIPELAALDYNNWI